MKSAWMPSLVAALFALFFIQVNCFVQNLEVGDSDKLDGRTRSGNMKSPVDNAIQLKSLDPYSGGQRTQFTLKDFLARSFLWNKQLSHDDKDKWPPLRFGIRTVIATVLTCAAACISSAGGLGGGGLFLPILNLVLQFDAKTSAALSAFMVLGGSTANVLYCVPLRRPNFDRKPLIDYDVALLLQPNMLLGISLGVICNVMFPEWLITALLASFLSYITFTSCKTGFRHWKAETILNQSYQSDIGRRIVIDSDETHTLSNRHAGGLRQENGSGNPSESIMSISCDKGIGMESEETLVPSSIGLTEDGKSLQEPLLNEKSVQYSVVPFCKLATLVLVWVSFFFLHILRGGEGDKSFMHIEPCGVGYWLISGLQIPLALVVTIWMISVDDSANEQHFSQQVAIKASGCGATFLFPFVALFAGILGGMLGIGGGMLINPFLLQMGTPPQVTAATCAFMVFFSSSMSVAQFSLLASAPLDYALTIRLEAIKIRALGKLMKGMEEKLPLGLYLEVDVNIDRCASRGMLMKETFCELLLLLGLRLGTPLVIAPAHVARVEGGHSSPSEAGMGSSAYGKGYGTLKLSPLEFAPHDYTLVNYALLLSLSFDGGFDVVDVQLLEESRSQEHGKRPPLEEHIGEDLTQENVEQAAFDGLQALRVSDDKKVVKEEEEEASTTSSKGLQDVDFLEARKLKGERARHWFLLQLMLLECRVDIPLCLKQEW
eukprot:Gb_25479 [translate_table: standard]